MSWISVVCLGLVIVAVHMETTGAVERKLATRPHPAAVGKSMPGRGNVVRKSVAGKSDANKVRGAGQKRPGRLLIPTRTTTTTRGPTTLKVVALPTRATTQFVPVPTDSTATPCDPCTGVGCPANCFECETLNGGTFQLADRTTC